MTDERIRGNRRFDLRSCLGLVLCAVWLCGPQVLLAEEDPPDSGGVESEAVLLGSPPSLVSITNPVNNAISRAGSNITINVSVSALQTNVTKVEFFADVTKLGEKTNSPYSLVWSNAVEGTYQLTAVTTDADGLNATSGPVTIFVVTNLSPMVSLTAPAKGSVWKVGTNITLSATATDADGTNKLVEFFANGFRLGEDASLPFSLIWSNVAVGSYELTAVTADNFNAKATSGVVNITVVSNLLPTVSLTSPTANATLKAGTNVTLTAAATDSDGTIARVEFFAGADKIGGKTNSPFSVVWSNLVVGSYTFLAIATDNAGGAATSAPVSISVVTNFRPVVLITSPGNNAVIGGPIDLVTINANATDSDNGIARVEFYESTNKIGQDLVTPFSIAWSNVAIGVYTLRAVATDNVGTSSTSAPVTLNVRTNLAPSVSLTNPINNSVFRAPTNITLAATATDSDGGIRKVEFFEGDNKLGEKTNATFSIIWSNSAAGEFILRAIATDISGATKTSAPVNISVITNLAPIVSISTPTNNTAFGGPVDVTITATAADSDGTVNLVEFFESSNKIGAATASPFTITWTNVPVGSYVLTALATDNSGVGATSAPVSLSIRTNLAPTVSISSPRNNALINSRSNVVFNVTATDSDTGIRKVEFFVNDLRIGESTASPYSITSSLAPGSFKLKAVATDRASATATSAPVKIFVVTNLLPIVAITNPVNNATLTAGSSLTLQVRASDTDGSIVKVEFFQGQTKIGETTNAPHSLVLSNLLPGHYTFVAKATDNVGDVTYSLPVSVSLDNRIALIAKGSLWKYLDDGSDQGTAWRSPTFDDTGWSNGLAQLGFGDGDEKTVINGGPSTNHFITTYFRQSFYVSNALAISNLVVRLLRDDGGVVYFNGTEVFRSNLPTTNDILFSTPAATSALADDETINFYPTNVSHSLLVTGTNVIAVEVHQISSTSTDLSFDFEMTASSEVSVIRGPYLQLGTPTSMTVRWRTDGLIDSRVRYGTSLADLNLNADDLRLTNEHSVTLTGLLPNTTYYYAVGSTTKTMAGGVDYFFTTSPAPGTSHPTRIWVLGDSGTGDASARSVRDAYYGYVGTRTADLWLMLGDNAYQTGTELEFQNALFDMFPTSLRQAVLWPTLSNHDVDNSTNPPPTLPYFNVFSVPTNAEVGGVPSGSRKYYSFDYGNIHVVSLDTQSSIVASNSPQYLWLKQDLAANKKDWLIAIAGNPPHGKIGNNTDTMSKDADVRTNLVPLLEAHGLDIYFAGDNHAYERSFLLDGYYGYSATLNSSMILDGGSGRVDDTGPYNKHTHGPNAHHGAVYVVNGSSGHLDPTGPFDPSSYITRVVLGSVILDVNETTLDLKFLTSDGVVEDYFTIVKSNNPPVAVSGAFTTDEDVPVELVLTGLDADQDQIVCRVLSAPAYGVARVVDTNGATVLIVTNGAMIGSGQHFLYTPATNFNGTDSLQFSANDGRADSPPQTITITVNPVNDAPVAEAKSLSVDEDTALSILLTGSDVEGDALSYVFGTMAHGTLTGTAPNLTYVPEANYHGPDSFTFKVNDGSVDSAPSTISITVNSVNDAPVARAQSFVTDEDVSFTLLLTASDIDGDALIYTATPPAHGTLSGSAPNLVYTPDLNYHGPDRFTFKVNDGSVDSASAMISITINSVNDAPVARAQSFVTDEDVPFALPLAASDVDGDPLTYTLTLPTHGMLTGTAPNLIYTPATNYFGGDSFTFKVNDGSVDSAPATISIMVNYVNDAPMANSQSVSTDEDTAAAITLTGSDVEGDALTYIILPPAHGTLTGTAPNLIYTPATNYFGDDSFTFRVNDGSVDSAPATISITMNSINDAPVANSQSVNTDEDAAAVLNLTSSDVDGDPLTYTLTLPAHGTLTGTAPNVIYTPATNYFGGDSFTFKVNDGQANSGAATINITVRTVNDAPVAVSETVGTDENTSLALTLHASDAEGDALTYTVVQPAHGTVTGAAPNLTYKPATNYFGGDSFTFKANDGQVNSGVATISITVREVNHAPVAKAQAFGLSMIYSNGTNTAVSPNNTDATVILDGTLSTDAEQGLLHFLWLEQGVARPLATGMIASVTLPIGTHSILLRVDDGAATNTDLIRVSIITAESATIQIEDMINASSLSQKSLRPLLKKLEDAIGEFNHLEKKKDKMERGLQDLEDFQNKVCVQITPTAPALSEALIQAAQRIIDSVNSVATKKKPRFTGGTCVLGKKHFHFKFYSNPGKPHLIQASVDLVRWETLGMAFETEDGGGFEFDDDKSKNYSQRFYRILLP